MLKGALHWVPWSCPGGTGSFPSLGEHQNQCPQNWVWNGRRQRSQAPSQAQEQKRRPERVERERQEMGMTVRWV